MFGRILFGRQTFVFSVVNFHHYMFCFLNDSNVFLEKKSGAFLENIGVEKVLESSGKHHIRKFVKSGNRIPPRISGH